MNIIDKEIIKAINDTIYDEAGIDFSGIEAGDYSINEMKEMLFVALSKGIEIRKGK